MLSITVPDTGGVGFNAFGAGTEFAFHYGSGGNFSFVTIKGTDAAVFSGIEFKLGWGFGASSTNLLWETRLGGSVTGSGTEFSLTRGGVVGWTDVSGIDELRVAANYSFTGSSVLGDFH